MRDRFKTKLGWLTPYALACGYVESFEINNVSLTLWMYAGCPGYHVREHDHNEHARVFWDSFDTLTDARKRFSSAKNKLLKN